MKSLLEFILESIGYSELSRIVEFVNVKSSEAAKIIEDHNGQKELGYWDHSPETILLFESPRTVHYKIMVNGTCVGMFSYINGRDIYNPPEEADCFETMVVPWAIEGHGKGMFGFTKKINRSVFRQIANNLIYVPYLFLFKDEKNMADLAPTAAIKVVFDKVKDIAKNCGVKYILAVGKDDRVTRLYQVAGGFKLVKGYPRYKEYERMFPDTIGKKVFYDEFYDEVSKHTVYYEL